MQNEFIKKINNLIIKKSFHPYYLKLVNRKNSFGSITSLFFPQISGKLMNEDSKYNNIGFTFTLWVKSNYETKNRTTKFFIFHLKPGNSKEESDSIEIFLECLLSMLQNHP